MTSNARIREYATWASLGALAAATRPLLFGITPLLPAMQADLETSYAVTALLVSVPVLFLAFASFATPYLAGRLGVTRAALLGLTMMLIAGVARAVLPDIGGLLAASVPLGLGAGICGVLLPMLVKSTVASGARATATGIYTVGLQLGGALAASACVPLALALGGWRPAFVVLGGLSAAGVAIWLVLRPRTLPPVGAATAGSSLPGPARRRWLAGVVVAFALLLVIFQGLNAWLPALYLERAWPEAAAGSLLGVLVLAQVPGALAAGLLADRRGKRRSYLILPSVALAAAIVLLVASPEAAWLWAVAAGLALGFVAPIILVVAVDQGADMRAVGGSSAVVLGVGYAFASISPFAIGVARDASGSFAGGLAALAGLALLMALTGLALPERAGAGIGRSV